MKLQAGWGNTGGGELLWILFFAACRRRSGLYMVKICHAETVFQISLTLFLFFFLSFTLSPSCITNNLPVLMYIEERHRSSSRFLISPYLTLASLSLSLSPSLFTLLFLFYLSIFLSIYRFIYLPLPRSASFSLLSSFTPSLPFLSKCTLRKRSS